MNPTEKTLPERMQLHELEIARRLELLGFTPADAMQLAQARSCVLAELDQIVDRFYAHQTSIDEIAVIIGDAETLRRLRAAQRGYVAELFGGLYAEDYVNNRLRIGLVHKRIGVEPKYYLSAVKVLKDLLRDVLRRRIADPAVLSATLEALDKLLYFDTQLVFDTYIGSMRAELEAAKDQTLQYARSLEQKVTERTRELEQLSRSDPLTGLLNRRALVHDLHQEIERAKRTASVVSLIYMDLDDFKQVNDRHGHQEGDQVLQRIGRAIGTLVREVDVAGRYGGDEFCIVLPGADRKGALQLVERLRERLTDAAEMSFSAGVVATGPVAFHEVDELLGIADALMYDMKHANSRRGRSLQPPPRPGASGDGRATHPPDQARTDGGDQGSAPR